MGFRHVIASHPTLGKLPNDDIDHLVSISREVSFPRRQLIQRAGEAPRGIFLVIDGFVKLSRTSDDGRELIVGLPGPDQLFGPCCQPIRPCVTPCVAEARTKVRAVLIPTGAWLILLKSRPAAAHVILDALLSSRQDCTNLAQDLAFLDLEARLAKLLLHLGKWSRPNALGEVVVPKILSQWELASGIGTAREVVTRKLQHLVDSGILRRQQRQIVICDMGALRSVAGVATATA